MFLHDLRNGKRGDLGPAWSLAWSPDGRELAISNPKQLFLVDPEGGEPRQLAAGEISSVSFSPDGKRIVFSNESKDGTDLFVVHLSDDRVSRLTSDGASHNPVWGTFWIAFSRWRFLEEYGRDYGAVSDLYLMRPDGSDVHELTIKEETAGRGKEDHYLRFGLVPQGFSTDGKRLLACVSIELGSCEIVTFELPNGPGRKLSSAEEPGAVWSAVLSPDGSEVLFEEGGLDDEQHHSIFTIPFEGGERRLLLRNTTQASWARGITRSRDDGS